MTTGENFGVRLLSGLCVAFVGGASVFGAVGDAPIAEALESVDEEVVIYNDHLTTLASPYMEGRLPGTAGMERAKDYVEYYFRAYGLEPAYPTAEVIDGAEMVRAFKSYRQPFALGSGTLKVRDAAMTAVVDGEERSFEVGREFNVTGMGRSGEVTGEVVFVGYSIADGPDDYSSFEDGDDLTGKIAVMLRFEPMNASGRSLWADRGGWSNRASFRAKLRAIKALNPAAVVMVNPPESSDPRAEVLPAPSDGGGRMLEVPVLFMSVDAGDALAKGMDPEGRSLLELRRLADAGRTMLTMNGEMTVRGTLDREELVAENVGGVLRGRGDLADEWIVVGAHLDHLGTGQFGSRSGPGQLHPGADDNASGAAGVMIFARRMADAYANLPEDQPLRSVLFMGFSGEESGLNGSRFYVNNSIVPIEDHVLMINFDMIGRIKNQRLSLSGLSTGEGLREFAQVYVEASPLDVQQPEQMSGASDHTPFRNKDIPVLFGAIADFHTDYHTPEDISSKINRVGAVETIRLFEALATGVAQRPERFEFVSGGGSSGRGGPQMSDIKVRFGVMPGTYDEDIGGVPLAGITEGGSADLAGAQEGDVLVRWNGQKVMDVMSWMEMLTEHKPGDEIKVGVKRDGEEVTLDVTLQAR